MVRESTKFVRGARNLFPHWVVSPCPLGTVVSPWYSQRGRHATTLFKYFHPCVWLPQPYSSTFTLFVAATTLLKYFHHVCGCNNPIQEFSPMCVAATTLFKYIHRVFGCNNAIQVLSPYVWLQQPYSSTFTLRVAVLTLFKGDGPDHLSEKTYSLIFYDLNKQNSKTTLRCSCLLGWFSLVCVGFSLE